MLLSTLSRFSLAAVSLVAAHALAQEPASKALAESPRHHEWIDAKHGERSVRCFVAYPEAKGKVPAVLLIHENKGLTNWVRSVADQVAEAGAIAIAPDLLSGMGPKAGNTDSFESVDAATKAIYALEQSQVDADLAAVLDHVAKLDSCNGTLYVAGFCWGGSQTFELATKRPGLKAACVFYGSAPKDEATLAKIDCPVYGFYGEADSRINAGVPATTDAMKKLGKTYEPVIYPGAGHGFMRAGEASDASPELKKARDDAWARWMKIVD